MVLCHTPCGGAAGTTRSYNCASPRVLYFPLFDYTLAVVLQAPLVQIIMQAPPLSSTPTEDSLQHKLGAEGPTVVLKAPLYV